MKRMMLEAGQRYGHVILALGRIKQEEHEFKASPSYTVRSKTAVLVGSSV